MAKQNKYHYVIFKGYIHKIPINKNGEERENSLINKDKRKKRNSDLILKII